MCRSVSLAAHYNVDSNLVKAQIYVTDECDNLWHPEDVISGVVQLFNVYNLPETGLQEVPLELVTFDHTLANEDGYFTMFFVNPAINTRLEARASLEVDGHGTIEVVQSVLKEEGTYSDSPSVSIIGTSENPSWHLDKNAQRDGYEQDRYPHVMPDMEDDQVVTPLPIINVLHADIQFEKLAEQMSDEHLPGALSYSGGGDRLLPKPGVLVFHPLDTPPWELGTSTFAEKAATELLLNNQYLTQSSNGFPSGYGLVDSTGIGVISTRVQTLQAEGFEAKAWKVQLNGAVPTSISPFNTGRIGTIAPVPFDISKPLSLSILAGMEKNTNDTSITSAKLIFTFYDFADRPITSMSKVLSVDELFNARPLKPFSISAKITDYPPTTEKVAWVIELGSIEQGDFVTLTTALPSLSQTPYATSQTLSGGSRVADDLSYAPGEPFNLDSGAVVMSLAIGFDVLPTEVKYFFDSRTPGTLLNGAALRAEPTGELTLLLADGATTVSLTSSLPVWASGEITEVVAEWSTAPVLRRISVNGTTVAQDTVAALPTGLSTQMITNVQLGADANVANHVDSEFLRVTFLKRPRA